MAQQYCSDERINELLNKRKPLLEELSNLNNAVEALRKICDHDWKHDGHGHNYVDYVCNKCLKTEER